VLTSDPTRTLTISPAGSDRGTYKITSSDVTNYFKAWATASNAGGTSSQANSSQVGPATVAPPTIISLAGPTVSRNSTSTYIYSTTNGSWNGSPTSYAYQWYCYKSLPYPPYSSYITISGATSATSPDVSAYVGYDIYCIVTATNSAPTSGTATSNFLTITTATGGSAPPTPTVSGNNSLAVGGTFTWSSTGATSYTWTVYNPNGTINGTYSVSPGTSTKTSWRPGYDGKWAGSGNYSLYVYATNSAGNSATANVTTYMT
jgi:hypothetical protein